MRARAHSRPGARWHDLRLVAANEWTMRSTAPSRWQVGGFWILEYITHGQIEVCTERIDWTPVAQGQGMLYPPRLPRRERVPAAAGGRPCRSCTVFFEHVPPAMEQMTAGATQALVPVFDPDEIVGRLMQWTVQHGVGTGRGVTADLLSQGCLALLVTLLVMGEREGHALSVREPQTAPLDLAGKANVLMRARLADNLTVGVVARALDLSETGFARAYRRLTGQSPKAALRQMRIEKAKMYLLRDRTPLDTIARVTGFADAYHLSRTFKQLVGVSPKEFRKGRRDGM